MNNASQKSIGDKTNDAIETIKLSANKMTEDHASAWDDLTLPEGFPKLADGAMDQVMLSVMKFE